MSLKRKFETEMESSSLSESPFDVEKLGPDMVYYILSLSVQLGGSSQWYIIMRVDKRSHEIAWNLRNMIDEKENKILRNRIIKFGKFNSLMKYFDIDRMRKDTCGERNDDNESFFPAVKTISKNVLPTGCFEVRPDFVDLDLVYDLVANGNLDFIHNYQRLFEEISLYVMELAIKCDIEEYIHQPVIFPYCNTEMVLNEFIKFIFRYSPSRIWRSIKFITEEMIQQVIQKNSYHLNNAIFDFVITSPLVQDALELAKKHSKLIHPEPTFMEYHKETGGMIMIFDVETSGNFGYNALWSIRYKLLEIFEPIAEVGERE